MTKKDLIDLLGTLTPGESLPGVRATFYFEEFNKQREIVTVKTNAQGSPEAPLHLDPLLAVCKKLFKDADYFKSGNRNHAFAEVIESAGIRRDDDPYPYPGLYTYEAYYIALAEKLRSKWLVKTTSKQN